MATVTRTVTINAAFLQEIKEDSQYLRRLLHDALSALAGHDLSGHPVLPAHPTHAAHKRRVDLLAELRDQLALHFALEEAYGYFEDALISEPRLNRQAEALRAEHSELFVELCAVEEQAERVLYHESSADALGEISLAFREFYERFLEHESRENDLILQAFADDIGDGD